MRITVLKENYTIKDEYSRIAEFEDAFHAGIFLNQLMDDAYQDGKITLKVVIDFPECDSEPEEKSQKITYADKIRLKL